MKYSKIAVSCAALFLVLFMLVGCFSGCRRKKKKMTSETTDYSQTASEQNSNQKITVKDNFGYVDNGGYAELVYYAGDMEATKIDIPSTLNLEVQPVENYNPPNKAYDTVDFDGEITLTTPLGADDIIVDIIDERISKHM